MVYYQHSIIGIPKEIDMCPSKLANPSPLPYQTRVITPDGAGKIVQYDSYYGYYTVQLDGTPDESCVEEYFPSDVSVEKSS